ncbi:MAG: GntR family transcriptional regulator [Thermomicrobium sp.]|nr:GntR family transcriptional regulator [Thermomicrobium sp.]MDW8006379.1 GntR family transcriptional regulator [Thermomicrobium sp.]
MRLYDLYSSDGDSLVDHVYRTLLEALVTGRLSPGQTVTQEELAVLTGASRTPVREALVRLEADGFVTVRGTRGIRIREFTVTDMERAWEARLAIEPFAARLAAERRDPQAIEQMELAIFRQRRYPSELIRSLLANRDFHVAMVAASQNEHLLRCSRLLWNLQLAAPIFREQYRSTENVLQWADEHEAILRAIVRGEGEAAEELARAHLLANRPPSREPERKELVG